MNIKHKCWYCKCRVKAVPIHDKVMHIELMQRGIQYQKSRRLDLQKRSLIFKRMIKKRATVR